MKKHILSLIRLVCVFGAIAPQPAHSLQAVDWSAIVNALRQAFSQWRFLPAPPPTATAMPTATFTATRTRTATRTATPSPTRTPTTDPALLGQIGFATAPGVPPAQKLASALIVFPYIRSTVGQGGTEDTRIELVNLSRDEHELQCFYVRGSDCFEIGFYVTLTAEQPLSWMLSEGMRNNRNFTNVPPFDGEGEMKCAVIADQPHLSNHNVLHGRAIVFDRATGETVGYGAIGFQRLSPGTASGVYDLDGFTYEQCPERLHFHVLTHNAVSSDLVVVPCSEDLLLQRPTATTVQLAIVNEFEQVFSRSFNVTCYRRRSFSSIGTMSSTVLGTATAHIVVRGVSVPLVGLVIDRFQAMGELQTTVNEPFLEGGRSATVIFP